MKRARLHASPQGRVTRRCKLVRTKQRHQEKPLPLDMQVLPQRMAPTPIHPGCTTERRHWGVTAKLGTEFGFWDFMRGKGLYRKQTVGRGRKRISRGYAVHVEDRVYYTDSVLYGMAWCAAAHKYGLGAEVRVC